MKRLLSILASALMVLAIVTPVSAEENAADVSNRYELETALNDQTITRIELTSDIDLSDAEWIGVVIDSGRELVIDGNNHTITGLKSYKAAKGPNGTGIAGDGGSCDYYNGWIAWNEGTLTIKDLNFEDAYVDTNPLTTALNSTGSSILAVVVANNTGDLIYNDVNVNNSIVAGYTKVGVLLGFTQGNGTTTIINSSVTNCKVVLEADGTDPEACFAGVVAGYDGNNKVKTYGVKLDNNIGEIDDSVIWDGHEKGVSESGVEYYVVNGDKYGMFSSTYSKGSAGIDSTSYVADIDGYGYESVSDAVNYALVDDKIILNSDITEDVVIPEGAKVTIDLNGHNITNVSNHTIINKGELTIEGEGTIDNVTHAKAALFNDVDATVVLKGGNYTRSKENGESSTQSGGNSYYNIVNHGSMTINDGVTVEQDGHFSSMVENGWYDGNQRPEGSADPILIINGGTFNGGLNTVKNDDHGILTINGGEFSNVTQATVLNWNETTINDGNFSSNGPVILNGYANDSMDKGTLIVNGGSFSSKGDSIVSMLGKPSDLENVTVVGGTFVSDGKADDSVKEFMDQDLVLDENGNVRVDNSELQDLYDKYVAEKLNKEDFTADSWAAYEKALTEAQTVLADVNATKEDIISAKEVLEKAHGALTLAPEEVLPPTITSGNNATWNTNSSDGLTFVSDALYKDFIKVLVDDKEVDNKYYTVKEGSTIVTLSKDYLSSLKEGTHTLSIVSTNGTATATFTIEAASITVPDTGITATITYLLPTTIILASGIILTIMLKKRYSR